MKQFMIRYRAKLERADENEAAIRGVFDELHAKAPAGLHYLVLRLEDGTFVHFVTLDDESAPNPMSGIQAFQAFQAGVRDRWIAPPESTAASIVGNYRTLAQP
jgi:hypothetical protein